MSEDLKSLLQRHEEWIDIVNRGDVEAYAGLLTEDVAWIPPDIDPIVGRESFKQWLAPFFSRFTYDFNISNEQINITGNRAVEKATFTSKITPREGGKSMQHSGTFIALWLRKEAGLWRIERYIDDTDM